MSKLILILFVGACLSVVYADNNFYPSVPASISDVETHRVGKHVVRLIRSFSDEGFLFIELLKPPEFSLINKRVVDKIKVTIYGRERVLDFRETASASIEKLRISEGIIKFQVDFYVLRGGRHLSECEVDANREKLPEPVCRHIPEDE